MPAALRSLLVATSSFGIACAPAPRLQATPWQRPAPLGLPPVPVPADDPITVEKVELGRMLFYDERVATQAHSSCADCHVPEHGFAGREPTMAFHRNVPTALNRAYGRWEFWDGSAGATLEELIRGVLAFVDEGATNPYWERLREIPEYRAAFARAFGRAADQDAVIQALSTYSRTLLAGDSPFDRYEHGDASAISEEAKRGLALFRGKAGCASCHSGANFTDEEFHDIGIGQEAPQARFYPSGTRGKPDFPELGRFNVTHRLEDRGAFKTPTLRELVSTGPYMHDGRFGTLEEVVAYYERGGLGAIGVDSRIHSLGLAPGEANELVAFLRTLSSEAPTEARGTP